jgi:hypothetical protein
MKKYIFVVIIEILICFYWLMFNSITFLNNSLLIMYIVGFPIIYLIFFIFNLIKNKKWYFYLISFIPIIFSFIFTYFVDGNTTFINNPDSSMHAWFYFYNFIRFIIQIGSIGIIALIFYLSKKDTSTSQLESPISEI